MSTMMKLAWRNIFRNKRRTIIAAIAIGVGLAALIFTDALIQGMKRDMIRSATSAYLGEGQIHRRGFRLTQESGLTINDVDRVMAELGRDPDVAAYAPRVQSFGMITSPAGVSSVLMVGVDPDREKEVSRLGRAVRQGTFFAGSDARDVLLGDDLADELKVSLGDRVVITVSQPRGGELAQDMFRVSGIYGFNIKDLDSSFAFVRLGQARKMLGLDGGINEIALRFRDLDFASRPHNPFWARFSTEGNEAVSWTVLLPQLNGVLKMVWVSLAFMALILFGVVAFGIINTLFMSLYERMFEFGVLRAVGTRPGGVRRLIVYEAGALAVLSNALGIVLGLVLTFIVSKTGIDYRGIEFAGTTFADLLYPVLHVQQFIIYPAAVFFVTVLVGLYPAVVAGRLRIADALRQSL
jgi:ABC-type lipoprotein release transport system permease subunit